MADIGQITLILALIFAICSAVASVAGTLKKNQLLAVFARNALTAVCVLYTFAIGIMLYALISNDFGMELVAKHSSKDLHLIYKIAALYSDKAGSLMFWGWLISMFALVLTFQKGQAFKNVIRQAIGILSVILAFFLVLITLVVNVFSHSPVSLQDGLGLNPQLQNPGIVIHPPLLFLGFAGFAIVFAFTIGVLILGYKDKPWVNGVRRWALFSWCMLGLANLVGAWWAWDVGNWGGYWTWDPVENAGIMPWLLGTALMHSISIQRKKSYLKAWAVVLVILTFALTLLSPFITHGGLQKSPLHGFVSSPAPPYIMSFIIIVLLGSLSLLIIRRECLQDQEKPQSLVSREGTFLLANIVLGLIVLVILIGTVIPGIAEHLGDNTVSIERGFFDWSAGPALLLLVFLMGICPLLGWGKSTPGLLRRNATYPLVVSAIAALTLLISGIGSWYALTALVCGLPFFTIIQEWLRGTRARHKTKGENYLQAYLSLNWNDRPRYGGFIVHIGIILITIGVIGSSVYSDNFLVNLMWSGGGVLLLGGIVAFWPDQKLAVPEKPNGFDKDRIV
jgi:cytochrome c-type biogenesis protein CcmF